MRQIEASDVTTPSIRGRSPFVFPLFLALFFIVLFGASYRAGAAPYAAMVIDARTGEVLHSRNADTRLHPASLTKMMTLYIAFEAVEHGEISLDTKVLISKKAASEEPSKLGLKAGQRIALRYLIRAAAVKSANDAATAIGESISGSEAAFARRMNRTAKALGMTRTTFKNAHGLTQKGHLSTARDMTTLGRHLFYDYPDYYNLFSRITTDAGVRQVSHTNRRFLNAYKGADGIKTGYTRAAGFNLVASAERGNERIITTVFGGSSTASRNARVAELMDLGFKRAPTRVAVRKPAVPMYVATGKAPGRATGSDQKAPAGKTIRVAGTVLKSPRPQHRPNAASTEADSTLIAGLQTEIEAVVARAAAMPAPALPPAQVAGASALPAPTSMSDSTSAETLAKTVSYSPPTESPKPHPRRMNFAAAAPLTTAEVDPIVVSRVSTSGGRHWGINVGRYPSRYKAERVLLKTALTEMATLDGALRKVAQRNSGFDANFMGMSKEQAALACRRLAARSMECTEIGPS